MSWLKDITGQIAAEHGLDPSSLALEPAEVRDLLDVARIAAHASGERTNAPLLCHVLGVARASGVPLADLSQTVRSIVGDPDVEPT